MYKQLDIDESEKLKSKLLNFYFYNVLNDIHRLVGNSKSYLIPSKKFHNTYADIALICKKNDKYAVLLFRQCDGEAYFPISYKLM